MPVFLTASGWTSTEERHISVKCMTAKEIVKGVMREKYTRRGETLFVLLNEEAYHTLFSSGVLNYAKNESDPFYKLPIHRRMSVCGMYAALVKQQKEPFVLILPEECPPECFPAMLF